MSGVGAAVHIGETDPNGASIIASSPCFMFTTASARGLRCALHRRPIRCCRLHHVAWYLSTEGVRDQSEPIRSGHRLAERLELLWQNLNQLLKLLQLRGHDLKQLL